MKILICEDNLILAMDLEMTIEEMGHVSVGSVTRSDDCLMRCGRDEPDMVIVDVDLDDGPTGAGLTKRLAAMGIPSVIISGQAEGLEAEDHAAAAVLAKPVAMTELQAALEPFTGEGCTEE